MIYQKLRGRAHIKSLDGLVDRYLPVSSATVRYSLNAFPRASVNIPYGLSFETEDSTELVDARTGYQIDLEFKESSYWTGWQSMFSGFVNSVSQVEKRSYQGGGRATRLQAISYLSYLDQQLNYSMDYSQGGLWFGTSGMRDVIGQPLAVEDSLRNGGVAVQEVLKDYLLEVINSQQQANLNYFNEGASRAETVINQGWSTDSDIYYPIFQNFDARTRDVIAHSITSQLAGSDGSLWSTILGFCNRFNYAVVPTAKGSEIGQVGTFAIAPVMRPGAVPEIYTKKIYIDEETSISSKNTQSRPVPVQKVLMLSRKRSGPWNLRADEGTRFILQMASLNENRPGSTEVVNWPGWFPGNTGIWPKRIAKVLCQQRLLDRRFSKERLQVRCPRLINYSPGSLVKLQGLGRSLPTTDDYNMMGVVDGVEVHMDPNGKRFYTKFDFTHAMSEESYEALSRGVHPVTWSNGYLWHGDLF